MPTLSRLSNHSSSSHSSAASDAPSTPFPAARTTYISVGSIVLHDTLRCEILRTAISPLGVRALAPGQPEFSVSRLTLQLRFTRIQPDPSSSPKAPNLTALQYIDARVNLSDSMARPREDCFDEPLHLADSLAGDEHYERILRGGTALVEDLKLANLNRERCPKPRSTGGFLVKEGCAPVVGMLGAQWVDAVDSTAGGAGMSGNTDSSARKRHRSQRILSDLSARHFLETIKEDKRARGQTLSLASDVQESPCASSHWEGEPSGSGRDEIVFHLRPIAKCQTCGINPLALAHAPAAANPAKTASVNETFSSSLAAHAHVANSLPNKTFRLVVNLLSMAPNTAHDGDQPADAEEFFAHFQIAFYFADNQELQEKTGEKGCCELKRHVFTASIGIGREGDMHVQQKKEVDVHDALAALEGKKSTKTMSLDAKGKKRVPKLGQAKKSG